jgi:hypothetical protein
VKVPRFRIASVMVFVALVALDFTTIRAVSDYADAAEIALLGIGALPMANVLAVGLLIGYRSRGNREFLLTGVREGHRTGVAWVEPRFLEARPTSKTASFGGTHAAARCSTDPPGASRTLFGTRTERGRNSVTRVALPGREGRSLPRCRCDWTNDDRD